MNKFKSGEIYSVIKAIAALRLEVFAEKPHCYGGDLETELRDLHLYAGSKEGIAILVEKEGKPIGLPIFEYLEPVRCVFEEKGGDYLADLVVLKETLNNCCF